MGVDFPSDRFRQRMSVADKHPAFRFAFATGDPSDHDQCERRQRQDGRQRREAERQFSEREVTAIPVPVFRGFRTVLLKSADNAPPPKAPRPCANSLPPKPSVGRKGSTATKVPPKSEIIGHAWTPNSAGRRFRHSSLRLPIEEQGLADHRLDQSALKGLVMRNAGSGAWPVKKRSGKAVMKMTGSS